MRAWALGCFHGLISTQTFWEGADRLGGQLRGDKRVPIQWCNQCWQEGAGQRCSESNSKHCLRHPSFGGRYRKAMLGVCPLASVSFIGTGLYKNSSSGHSWPSGFPAVSLILFLGGDAGTDLAWQRRVQHGELERLRLLCAPSPVIPRYRNEIRKWTWKQKARCKDKGLGIKFLFLISSSTASWGDWLCFEKCQWSSNRNCGRHRSVQVAAAGTVDGIVPCR